MGPTVLYEALLAERVIALEPSWAYGTLCASLGVNPDMLPKVTLFQAALDKSDGYQQLTIKGDSTDELPTSASSSHKAKDSLLVRTLSISTLRALAPDLERVGFIKMDVEGYERVLLPVLKCFW